MPAAPSPAASELRATVPLRAESDVHGRPTQPLSAERSLELRTTTPRSAEASETDRVRAAAPSDARRRGGGRWIVLGSVAVAISAGAIAIVHWTSVPAGEPTAAVVATNPPVAPDAASSDAAMLAPADASIVAIADLDAAVAPPPPVRVQDRPRLQKVPSGGGQRPPPPAVPPPISDAGSAAVAAPAVGTLAVSSDPIGVVVIDGSRMKSTPYQTTLPVGDYNIVVELAEGAGTLRAKAHVDSGRKTKCKVEKGILACAATP